MPPGTSGFGRLAYLDLKDPLPISPDRGRFNGSSPEEAR